MSAARSPRTRLPMSICLSHHLCPLPSRVKVMDLQLAFSDLYFQPQQHLVFNINNASISLRFRRQLLYWFL